GVEWVSGLSGNAMRTDEDGDFLRITNDSLSDHVNAGTVQAWVYPEGENYYTGIVHKGEETNFSDEAWSLQFHTDLKPYFYFVSESGTAVSLMAPDQIPLNAWSHLSATWSYDVDTDTTEIILYVNGTAVVTKSETGIGPAKASDGDVLIGSQLPEQYNASYGHLTFMEIIDEVAMYDR
ncbi:MAG: LamG domain-containing protein, partial [Spirochaetaceae bacterium]|nr:LamG domain-containing protein [Spirochaetaceae bacterium]